MEDSTGEIPLTISRQFQMEWFRHYGTCRPIGWHLRQDHTRPWVRFHELPRSKRYAEDETERSIILSRGNSIGMELFGPGTPCWIIEPRNDEAYERDGLWTVSAEDDDPHDPGSHFRLRKENWQFGRYDAKLLAVANNISNRAVWVRCNTGAVFAPYDGGFDIFSPTWQEVRALKRSRRDWLSEHPEGL